MQKLTNQELLEKWDFLLEAEGVSAIKDLDRKIVTAQLLENTEDAFTKRAFDLVEHPLNEATLPTTNTGNAQNYDPVLISLIRRSAPKLLAFDVLGVQPMTGPTGQIFAMRSRYSSNTGPEAFYNEANTGHSTVRGGTDAVGDASLNVGTVPSGDPATYNFAGGMTTAQAEALGTAGNTAWPEMTFTVEKIMVEAQSRALAAGYTTEFAQDLKAIHGLDAYKELAKILSTELVAEINREVIRTIYLTAVSGAPAGRVTNAGEIDLDIDTNGRWFAERCGGLVFHLDLECNDIAKRTRRGRGNILMVSSNVASALRMAKVINMNEAAGLAVDDTGSTYAGSIGLGANAIKVYIDPYATSDYAVVGYKGTNSWDAGLFYCPYTPLQMYMAKDEDTFTPKIGFKTRYGMVANPFSKGATASNGTLEANANVYYSRIQIKNII